MTTVRREILNRLRPNGWQQVAILDAPPDWWADEVWLLGSLWPPQECRVYLVFVVDPQWEGAREKGQGIWAVCAGLGRPDPRWDVRLTLERGWRKRLPELFTGLSALRHLWPQAEPSAP